jgi:putative SOS response-associated peptidase YedK
MCAHFETITAKDLFRAHFGAALPAAISKADVYPVYQAAIILRPALADVGDDAVPQREALAATFGLIPHWAKDSKIARSTYNARSETVAEKPSFRDSWRTAKHCIIPAQAIYEPDWRSGKSVATRISRRDGAPMGIAGLWASHNDTSGATNYSFTMLTINADGHDVMQHFHKPEDEKRMVVILPENRYDDWLKCDAPAARSLLTPYPAAQLLAVGKLVQPPQSKQLAF